MEVRDIQPRKRVCAHMSLPDKNIFSENSSGKRAYCPPVLTEYGTIEMLTGQQPGDGPPPVTPGGPVTGPDGGPFRPWPGPGPGPDPHSS
jgi:hypothetical protein